MTLTVNGRPLESDAPSLEALLVELGYAERKVATAINGNFVRAALRAETSLSAGDRIDVVVPMQGG